MQNDNTIAHGSTQYLTFKLGGEDYGVPILRVQEIKAVAAVTPIPNSPSYVRGVMNLRGTVMPVIDLRLRLGLQAIEETKFAVTVVVSMGAKCVGLVVDSVSDVQDFPTDTIEAPPQLGTSVETSYLTGIAKHQERLIALLDLERVFGLEPLTV